MKKRTRREVERFSVSLRPDIGLDLRRRAKKAQRPISHMIEDALKVHLQKR